MSVDSSAEFGLGWIVTPQERKEMEAAAGDQWGDVEDYFHRIDCYRPDSNYFLGEFLGGCDEGDFISLKDCVKDARQIIYGETFINKYTEILQICGRDIKVDSKWAEAEVFLIHRLW